MKKAKQTIYFLVILVIFSTTLFAQRVYKGEPVTQNGLIKALKLRQFQTAEIIEIIDEQGVDFRLTSKIQEELVKNGARPELLAAVNKNYRSELKIKPTNLPKGNSPTYESLISQAISIYESESNEDKAISILNRAVELEPNKYRAYQMLGYVTLYGQRDFKKAEAYMRKAIDLGGSAVFRVKHSHDYNFLTSCSGSFYISRNYIRYEDDDNVHTFQVNDSDIIKIDTGNKWAGLLKLKGGIFNVVIRDKANVKDKDKYQFSSLTGKTDEAKMIIRLIGKN